MTTLPFSSDTPWLAPLAGYSDLPFRILCRRFGAAVCETEMISVKGLDYANPGTRRLLATTSEDSPLVVQLFGNEPQRFPRAMAPLLERGYTHFDLNAGCPVKKVIKSGAGAAMLLDLDNLLDVVRSMVAIAGPRRVGVKTRLGYRTEKPIFLDLARRLEDLGVAWITLHPRSACQSFSGAADWSRIAELKDTVSIPIIASGDLYTAQDGLRCLAQTGADTLMYARGALTDPAIFSRHRARLCGEPEPERSGPALADIVRQHILLTRDLEPDSRAFRKVRSIIPRYVKGLRDTRTLRASLSSCQNYDDLLAVAERIAEMDVAGGADQGIQNRKIPS